MTTQQEAAEQIWDETKALARRADALGLSVLAYLLEMAAIEARARADAK